MALTLLGLPVELLDCIADQFPEAGLDGRICQHDAKSLWLVCRKTEMKTRIWSERNVLEYRIVYRLSKSVREFYTRLPTMKIFTIRLGQLELHFLTTPLNIDISLEQAMCYCLEDSFKHSFAQCCRGLPCLHTNLFRRVYQSLRPVAMCRTGLRYMVADHDCCTGSCLEITFRATRHRL